MNRLFAKVLVIAVIFASSRASATSIEKDSAQPIVIGLTLIPASRAADVIRRLYPHDAVQVDRASNSIIVLAPPTEVPAIRAVVAGLDVRNPQVAQTDVIAVTSSSADLLATHLKSLFPQARISVSRHRLLIVTASPIILSQIHPLVTALDTPSPAPSTKPAWPPVAFPVTQGSPSVIARSIAHALPRTQVAVAGGAIVVRGSPEDIQQVKSLLEQIDRPAMTSPYASIYKLTSVDASAVADLVMRSFPSAKVEVEKNVNAISVTARAADQTRIAGAIAQLDVPPANQGSLQNPFSASGEGEFDVLSLHAVVPASSANGSSTAADIAQAVSSALGSSAPDLKITVQPNSTRLILSGSARSRTLAKALIAQLDVAEPLVELDTRVLEVDEGSQTQLGLKFPTPVLGTTYSETTPTDAGTGVSPQLLRLQPLTRTPLTLEAELDFLIANNEAKILEDPRITTFSGRTATLRAGETVNILTTAGGGTGTVATTQIQSFQTGVTLDITPVVNADNYITVTLHPSVNSIAGIGTSGVPNIQTRDTTTTIGLHDGETLIVGGLIEDTDTKTVQKIPLLGDLPLIGRFFQDVGTSHARNELVVTVTPHILRSGEMGSVTHLSLAPSVPKMSALAGPTTAPTVREPTIVSVPVRRLSDGPSPGPSVPASPIPVPSAFAEANTYIYGAAPVNNFAAEDQPPQIFFAKLQPTIVRNGDTVVISALTTTNVASVLFGDSASSSAVKLQAIGPGRWQSTFTADASNILKGSGDSGTTGEPLIATTAQGNSTTIRLPISTGP